MRDEGSVAQSLEIGRTAYQFPLELNHDEIGVLVQRKEVDAVFAFVELDLSANHEQWLAESDWIAQALGGVA